MAKYEILKKKLINKYTRKKKSFLGGLKQIKSQNMDV